MAPEEAFKQSCESITGPITKTISHDGILALYESLGTAEQAEFKTAYSASYLPAREILQECYDEVASGNEIRSLHSSILAIIVVISTTAPSGNRTCTPLTVFFPVRYHSCSWS